MACSIASSVTAVGSDAIATGAGRPPPGKTPPVGGLDGTDGAAGCAGIAGGSAGGRTGGGGVTGAAKASPAIRVATAGRANVAEQQLNRACNRIVRSCLAAPF